MAKKISVCLISERELARIIHYGIEPSHKEHRHLTELEAIEGLQHDMLRVVDEALQFRIHAVIEPASNGYVWKSRLSGGANCRQMVRQVQG